MYPVILKMTTKVKVVDFETEIIDSFDESNAEEWAKNTLGLVTQFHALRGATNLGKAQTQSFTNIRRGIFSKLDKVKTGDETLDNAEDRWQQTKLLNKSNSRYMLLVKIVDPLIILKHTQSSKEHNKKLRLVIASNADNLIIKFSIRDYMDITLDVLHRGIGRKYEWQDVFAALLYCTGRRQELIFQKMTFIATDKKYKIACKGFAKSMSTEKVELPCLFDNKIIVQRIRQVRKVLESKAFKTANEANRYIANSVRKFYPEVPNAHKLRGMYAVTCDTLFNNTLFNDVTIHRLEFMKRALNHSNKQTTDNHYDFFNPSDLQTDAEVSSYVKRTMKHQDDVLTADTTFVPLDISIIVPDKTSLLQQRVAQNIKLMTLQPIEIDFKNYKKLYGGNETVFNFILKHNGMEIGAHNEHVSDFNEEE